MEKLNQTCDYIIFRLTEAGERLNFLKLHKLLFYVQAWHLAIEGSPLFQGKFQAWVHGPVSRPIYDRFIGTGMYSPIGRSLLRTANFSELTEDDKNFINSVLDVYGSMTGTQLEALTHEEEPWLAARGGIPPEARCENEIDEGLMASFYGKMLVGTSHQAEVPPG